MEAGLEGEALPFRFITWPGRGIVSADPSRASRVWWIRRERR